MPKSAKLGKTQKAETNKLHRTRKPGRGASRATNPRIRKAAPNREPQSSSERSRGGEHGNGWQGAPEAMEGSDRREEEGASKHAANATNATDGRQATAAGSL